MRVKAYNPPFGIGSSPVAGICAAGELPCNPSDGVDVDWGGVTFASVSQVGALAAVQLRGKAAGRKQEVSRPKSDAMGYLQRIDYFSSLGIDIDEQFVRHDTASRLVPISMIRVDGGEPDPNEITAKVKTVITSHVGLSKSVSDNLDLSLGEIIDNVIQHSGTDAPGVACAQYYKKHGYVEVCVADCGVGIPASMSENPAYAGKDDDELLEMAFQRNTGQWYGRSRIGTEMVSGGMGLSFASSLVRAIGGHIWAISRGSAVHVSARGTERLSGLFYPGTLIVVRVPETMDEVSHLQMYGYGPDIPVYWNCMDGRHCDENPLW